MVKFGNWQRFLDAYVDELRQDSSSYQQFKNFIAVEQCVAFVEGLVCDQKWNWVKKYFENVKNEPCCKSSTAAAEHRKNGNKYFQKRQFTAALESYNQSVLCSPRSDDCCELAFAIANRSAVFFHINDFEHCLSDITMATELNYPKELRPKLLVRAGQCYVHLSKLDKAVEAFTNAKELIKSSLSLQDTKTKCVLQDVEDWLIKLSSNALSTTNRSSSLSQVAPVTRDTVCETAAVSCVGHNAVLKHASNSVKLCVSAAKGRHLVTSESVKAGDVLIVEQPFAAVLLPSHYKQRCHHCLSNVTAAVPCANCTVVQFCSLACQKASWNSYHYIECQFLSLLHSIGIAHLSLRIVLVSGLQFLIDVKESLPLCYSSCESDTPIPGLNSEGTYGCNYWSVYHLMPHMDDMATDDLFQYTLTAYLLLMLLDNTGYFTDHPEVSVRHYVGGLLLRHVCQLVCNAHAITQVERTANTSFVDVSCQARVATAIYPTASLMNHSCVPNIISSFDKDTLVVRAVCDIDAGSEIFNCYGPHWKRMCRSERQQVLCDQYFFECQCEACLGRLMEQQLVTALQCQHCAGAAIDCTAAYTCVECGRSVTDLSSVLDTVKQANQLSTLGLQQLEKEHVNEALSLFEQCLHLRKSTLYKHNKDLSHLYDAIAQCHAIKGDFELCSQYLCKSLLTTEVIYGASSIELANELLKYAEVCTNAHQLQTARTSAKRALHLFTLHYGPECNAVTDLRTLLASLTLTEA